ncbi:RDD family protein [Pseudomarimonas salicorniae]|uniref:RDD family protein n=1 Tax=Pseudomarimonas salicorniae TaxID=2933270 RepID=A0ABT0GC11_9GAMM|nr:RDD family protein [Lysobacter sp. CAU 1642]MCK7592055.1 RDD family protein [Lysobacter sp. CAU 1642]
MSTTTEPTAASDLAGVGKRIGGGLIDLFVSFVLIMILGAASGFGAGTSTGEATVGYTVNVDGMPFLYMSLIVFGLFTLLEWKLGKTPGKMLLKMRVVLADRQTATFGAALIRNLFRVVDGLGLYLVGLIIIATDSENRRLGDMFGGTRVVND